MKRSFMIAAILLAAAVLVSPANADSQKGGFGIRAGLATDINLGVAFGLGGGFLVPVQSNYVELGAVFFGGSYSETSNNGFNDYEETTDLLVVGAMANFLFGYEPYQSRTYFIAGLGLASVSMSWEESSPTDVSLGTPLPGGGSKQSEDGGGGGTVFNLGVGHSLASGVDFRAELPLILAFSAPGEASTVVPTFMVTVGYRF